MIGKPKGSLSDSSDCALREGAIMSVMIKKRTTRQFMTVIGGLRNRFKWLCVIVVY